MMRPTQGEASLWKDACKNKCSQTSYCQSKFYAIFASTSTVVVDSYDTYFLHGPFSHTVGSEKISHTLLRVVCIFNWQKR